MKNAPPINYVFRLSVASCAKPGEWIERSTIKQSNTCRDTPVCLAGNIASHYLKVAERGVKVEFLGLQEDNRSESVKKRQWAEDKPLDGPITPMNPFTLTVVRTEA